MIFQETEPGVRRLVETHKTGAKASYFTRVLNEHERRNGRPENYGYAHAPETDS